MTVKLSSVQKVAGPIMGGIQAGIGFGLARSGAKGLYRGINGGGQLPGYAIQTALGMKMMKKPLTKAYQAVAPKVQAAIPGLKSKALASLPREHAERILAKSQGTTTETGLGQLGSVLSGGGRKTMGAEYQKLLKGYQHGGLEGARKLDPEAYRRWSSAGKVVGAGAGVTGAGALLMHSAKNRQQQAMAVDPQMMYYGV